MLFTVVVIAIAGRIDRALGNVPFAGSAFMGGLTVAVGFSGILDILASLVTIPPLFAAGWRRVCDTGLPGWLVLLLPGTILLFIAAIFVVPASMIGSLPLIFLIAMGCAMLMTLFWLCAPTRRNPLANGPNPSEVTQ